VTARLRFVNRSIGEGGADHATGIRQRQLIGRSN
jgi:hypothetical protein